MPATRRRRRARWRAWPCSLIGWAVTSRLRSWPGTPPPPLTRTAVPELASLAEHLRGVLGPDRYTTLSDQGKAVAPADAVRYALVQIDLAREL